MDEEQPDPPASSQLADEAVKLLGAVQEWTRTNFPGAEQGHGGPDCEWCPICRLVSVLRGERPEVTERIAEAGNAMLAAVRSVLDAAPSPSSKPPRPSPGPRVQRIPLGDQQ